MKKYIAYIIPLFFTSDHVFAQQPDTDGFRPEFTILYTAEDPNLAMRPAGIPRINYNVATWKTYPGKVSDLPITKKDAAAAGDGFDDSILAGRSSGRTVSQYNAAEVFCVVGEPDGQRGDTIFFSFKDREKFSLSAYYVNTQQPYPQLHFRVTAKQAGWFSVGYTGAPSHTINEVEEIWQPLVWQEKRFPDKPYLTLAFRCPIPSALVRHGGNTIGVLAASSEFPFDPLPLMQNSRFGVSVRSNDGEAQPQLWAPVLGGANSRLEAGMDFDFTCLLPKIEQPLTYAYEEIARREFGFSGFRRNEISSLNDVLGRMTDYALSEYAWFIDSLKGCAYSTDVPGAVKNVSSLNPLNLAVVMDNPKMFEERGYPILEYMLSREKFLFSLDPEQKIQNPSRKLEGPVAPVSELTALYTMFGKSNPFFLDLAQRELTKKRIRNLDVEEDGANWINAMHLYRSTGENKYLEKAVAGADNYLKQRVQRKQTDFDDPFAGAYFFWPAFTNRWIELLELYEITKEDRYLLAARDGARHYAQFCWMAPAVPDGDVTVNEGGNAPLYWYLKSKGHQQMKMPEEQVPAWRLSEIGLTAESSGTSTGHRAIFMANYAPWMLRLGYYTGDKYLQELAKNAIVGRYRNFPGYHINTARTTAYEKADYPLRPHIELSVNSFHYNHILPMISMLLDYLVTDAFVKSEGRIDFPSDYIEGYAYLQNKMYGHQTGTFVGEQGVQLWMPPGLLQIDDVELNYLSARKGNKLYLAFMNQSEQPVSAQVSVNDSLVSGLDASQRTFRVEVPASGIATLVLDNVNIQTTIQDALTTPVAVHDNDYLNIPLGRAKAMVIRLGSYATRAYIYLPDDDSVVKSASVAYTDVSGKKHTLVDESYPYEFTIPLTQGQDSLQFELTVEDLQGNVQSSGVLWLGATTPPTAVAVQPEFHLRDGLHHFFAKAREGNSLRVAYIGGSITRVKDQYREQTTNFIRKLFAPNEVEEIVAGVSGTDADLGACRIREQVLDKNPDLVFIEFAVNGGYGQGIEGMIRQIRDYDPTIDIALIHTVRASQLDAYIQGDMPIGIKHLEKIADHYQITSVHLGMEVARLVDQGAVIARGNPTQSNGTKVFSRDGTHPLRDGGDLYAMSIARMLMSMRKTQRQPTKHSLPEPLHADHWQDAGMYAPEEAAQFHGQWQRIKPTEQARLGIYQEWFPYVMKGQTPGDAFTVKFRGDKIGIFDVGGPEVGQLMVSVDGKPATLMEVKGNRYRMGLAGEGKPGAINRFNRFCNNRYRGQYAIIELPEGEHEVTFSIAKEQPNKHAILGDNQQDDIRKHPEKYNQSVVYVGKILLRGELLN